MIKGRDSLCEIEVRTDGSIFGQASSWAPATVFDAHFDGGFKRPLVDARLTTRHDSLKPMTGGSMVRHDGDAGNLSDET
jgi:hypothetical protein